MKAAKDYQREIKQKEETRENAFKPRQKLHQRSANNQSSSKRNAYKNTWKK